MISTMQLHTHLVGIELLIRKDCLLVTHVFPTEALAA